MKKYLAFPALALLGGGSAFFLRLAQNRTGLEIVTGLPVAGSPWGGLLVGLLMLTAAACCLLLRTLPQGADEDITVFSQAFSTRSTSVLSLLVAGVFLLALSGALELLESLFGPSVSRLSLIQGVMSLISAACIFPAIPACRRSGTREAKQTAAPSMNVSALLVPVCLLVVRLVLTYRTHSINPTLAAYYVELLAQVFLTLALYRLSSFAFQAGRTRRFFLYAVPAILLCLTTLADGHPLDTALFYGGGALVLLAFLLMRLENLTHHRSIL